MATIIILFVVAFCAFSLKLVAGVDGKIVLNHDLIVKNVDFLAKIEELEKKIYSLEIQDYRNAVSNYQWSSNRGPKLQTSGGMLYHDDSGDGINLAILEDPFPNDGGTYRLAVRYKRTSMSLTGVHMGLFRFDGIPAHENFDGIGNFENDPGMNLNTGVSYMNTVEHLTVDKNSCWGTNGYHTLEMEYNTLLGTVRAYVNGVNLGVFLKDIPTVYDWYPSFALSFFGEELELTSFCMIGWRN